MKRLRATSILGIILLISGMALTAMAAEKETLNYWSRKIGPESTAAGEMIQKFNETHPGIQVNFQILPWGGAYYGKIRSSILVGRPPEIFDVAVYAPPMFLPYIKSFTNEDLVQMGIKTSDYFRKSWDRVKYNDKYYGIPLGIIPFGILYNKDMFEKASLDPEKPPRNLEEFIEYGKKLTKDTDGDGEIDQWGCMNDLWYKGRVWIWESILVQNGGSLLNDEKTKAAFNNKAGLDALNIMLDFSRKDKIAPEGVSNAGIAFIAEKVAMHISGIWAISALKDKIPLGTGPLPQFGSQRPATWSSLDIYLFPKQKRKDMEKWKATATYTQWVAGPEGQKFYARMYLPARLDVLNSPVVQADPYMSGFAKAVDSIFFAPAHKDTQEIYSSISSSFNGLFAGTISAEQALAQAEKQTNRILARQ